MIIALPKNVHGKSLTWRFRTGLSFSGSQINWEHATHGVLLIVGLRAIRVKQTEIDSPDLD